MIANNNHKGEILKAAKVYSIVLVFVLVVNHNNASSESLVGGIDDEILHPDGLVSLKAESFRIIADQCFEYFTGKRVEVNPSWWNVRIVNPGTSWRVILTGPEFNDSWMMCLVTRGNPEVRSFYTVVELPK